MTCFCFPDQRQMKENCGVRETGEMVETARASQPGCSPWEASQLAPASQV